MRTEKELSSLGTTVVCGRFAQPTLNYTQARDDAMQFTSYPIAQAALSTL